MEGLSKTSRILVTGGHGFLGQYVTEELESRGYINFFTPEHSNFDFRNRDDIKSVIKFLQPEAVIHMAAVLGGLGTHIGTQGQFLYDNLIMGLEMMEQARQWGVKTFVNIGTACSYPQLSVSPVVEGDLWTGFPNETTAPYGVAKLVLMLQGQYYRSQYGMKTVNVIPANVYGPRDTFDDKKSHAIPALIKNCIEAKRTGSPFVVWGSGNASREFIFATDCAEGIVKAMEWAGSSDPINLGTGVSTAIREVAWAIAEKLDFDGPLVWDSSKPDGHPGRVFDVTRAQTLLGFRAHVGLHEGLHETIRWYLETQKHA
jgi:GDP-L-fucose synthase